MCRARACLIAAKWQDRLFPGSRAGASRPVLKLQTIMIFYCLCCLSLEGGKTKQGVYVCVGVGFMGGGIVLKQSLIIAGVSTHPA